MSCILLNDVKPVVGFVGYFVDQTGRVFSARRNGELQLLKPFLNKYGNSRNYMRVTLCKKSWRNKKHKFVHIVVLETFVGLKPKNMQARHLDGNSLNNNLSNLIWGTKTENEQDKVRHGSTLCGESSPVAKLNNLQARIVKRCGDLPRNFLAEVFSVRPGIISAIRGNRSYTTVVGQPTIYDILAKTSLNLNFTQFRLIKQNLDLSVSFLAEIFKVDRSMIYQIKSGNINFRRYGWDKMSIGSVLSNS